MTPRKPKKAARLKAKKPKKAKPSLTRTYLTYVLIVSAVPLSLIFYFIPTSLDLLAGSFHRSTAVLKSVAELPEQNNQRLAPGMPVRLRIPAINVDAPVQRVGLTPDGAMDVPKTPQEAGWFEPGVRPGEIGSAVIAGHYGWKEGKAAAFDALHQLKEGDKVYVEDDAGYVKEFTVSRSRLYDSRADTSEVFGSSDGKARLNLITCEGTYDKQAKSYSNRLVVFAELENI